jgi:acetoin utilization protein AcuC
MADSALKVVYGPEYLEYDFGPGHPFTPVRWDRLHAILRQFDLPADWITPEAASDDDILTVHSLPFVEAVKSASAGHGTIRPGFMGLGTGDVPIFYGMHEATQAVCGGSLEAARLVRHAAGSQRVLQLGGGLHHAMPGHAAGFCVYNDVAMAIRRLLDGGMRVAFLDIDVHHSDGVQEILYDEPGVLTISLHESGRFMFPGTGFENEHGGPEAPRSAINFPLHPGTDDDGYLACFDAVVPRALDEFQPDVLVIEAGADAYVGDPLAHLSLSLSGYRALFDRIIELAEKFAKGRLLVTLGGGYDVDATVAIWSMLAFRMADAPIPDEAVTVKALGATASDRNRELAQNANADTLEKLRALYWSKTMVKE